jgi:hypothetical protein
MRVRRQIAGIGHQAARHLDLAPEMASRAVTVAGIHELRLLLAAALAHVRAARVEAAA